MREGEHGCKERLLRSTSCAKYSKAKRFVEPPSDRIVQLRDGNPVSLQTRSNRGGDDRGACACCLCDGGLCDGELGLSPCCLIACKSTCSLFVRCKLTSMVMSPNPSAIASSCQAFVGRWPWALAFFAAFLL